MVVVALIVFGLLRLTPGDPAAVIAGDYATPDDVAKIRAKLGLDQPLPVQLSLWFGNVLRGDLGTSIFSGLPVTTLIKQRIEPTSECKGDAYLGDFQLPRSLGEALALLRAEKDLHEVLGSAFITVYTEVKEIEYAEFMKVISPWEREHLLLHV